MLPPKKPSQGKNALKLEYSNSWLFTNLINQKWFNKTLSIQTPNIKSLFALLAPHLWDSYPTVVVLILNSALRQTSPQIALPTGQHMRPEAMFTRVISRRLWSSESQKTRPKKWVSRNRGNAILLRPLIPLQNLLHRDNQPISWQSSNRVFWNWKNTRAGSPKILLINAQSGCWDLGQDMWHMFYLKIC